MIIGVNGKIGSGKDTVGKIIQYLTANEEVKKITTLEEWLDSDDLNGRDFNWKIKKFAGKLKQTASLLTGIPIEMFEDQEFKKQEMPEEWNNKDINWGIEKLHGEHIMRDVPMTYRTFLQKLGTEGMRVGVHTNVWVNALFADYKPQDDLKGIVFTLKDGSKQFVESQLSYPSWCITDMRFPNEMEAVVARGGITIRVVRPDMNSLQAMVPAHASETALDEHTMHYDIINDGTIEDLVEKVREILIERNII